MEKIIMKNEHFSGKGRQSLIYKRYNIYKILISCIKLDHALYSIN